MRKRSSTATLAYGASLLLDVSAVLVAGSNCNDNRTAPVLGLAAAGCLTFAFARMRRPGQSVVTAVLLGSLLGLVTVLAAYGVALMRCLRISF